MKLLNILLLLVDPAKFITNLSEEDKEEIGLK